MIDVEEVNDDDDLVENVEGGEGLDIRVGGV